MDILKGGLRVASRGSAIKFSVLHLNNPPHTSKLFQVLMLRQASQSYRQFHIGSPRNVRPCLRSPFLPSFTHPRRCFHISSLQLAEDPQAFKPRDYPEAEWQRINEEFERRLARRS